MLAAERALKESNELKRLQAKLAYEKQVERW